MQAASRRQTTAFLKCGMTRSATTMQIQMMTTSTWQTSLTSSLIRRQWPSFGKQTRPHPFSEWQHASELLDAAPDFEIYHEPPENLWSGGKRKKLYFWHANLLMLEPHLRKMSKPGQVESKYGPSPDKPTVLLVNAAECPLFVVRQVPVECELYQAIFDKATEMLHLHKGNHWSIKASLPRKWQSV